MKKRTAVILTALLIVSLFIFTGCANNDDPLNDGNQGSASQEIERGVDDIGDGIERGVDDIGDDLTAIRPTEAESTTTIVQIMLTTAQKIPQTN